MCVCVHLWLDAYGFVACVFVWAGAKTCKQMPSTECQIITDQERPPRAQITVYLNVCWCTVTFFCFLFVIFLFFFIQCGTSLNMHTEILGCCMLGFVFKKRHCAWRRWGEQQRKQTEDQTESDRQSDREALPHTHVVNVLSLTVSNSHSQMYYTIYIISNSSQPCCFDLPTGI